MILRYSKSKKLIQWITWKYYQKSVDSFSHFSLLFLSSVSVFLFILMIYFKQLRITASQSWLIYFKYQTTQNCSIAILVDIFKYQTSQNCSITIFVDIFQISNKSELQHYNVGSKYTCDALRDLISFVQFKKRKKHPWRIVTFSRNAGLSLQLCRTNGNNSHKASYICFV